MDGKKILMLKIEKKKRLTEMLMSGTKEPWEEMRL